VASNATIIVKAIRCIRLTDGESLTGIIL